MKATSFGKYLRRLRIDHEMLMKDMADRLNVSTAYLSGVELGKKAISDELINKIVCAFGLSELASVELRQAAQVSQPSVKIELVSKSNEEREMVMSFARKYESLSPESREKLMRILED